MRWGSPIEIGPQLAVQHRIRTLRPDLTDGEIRDQAMRMIDLIAAALEDARRVDLARALTAEASLMTRTSQLTDIARTFAQALRYYDDPDNWDNWVPIHHDPFIADRAWPDGGDVAREALARYRDVVL